MFLLYVCIYILLRTKWANTVYINMTYICYKYVYVNIHIYVLHRTTLENVVRKAISIEALPAASMEGDAFFFLFIFSWQECPTRQWLVTLIYESGFCLLICGFSILDLRWCISYSIRSVCLLCVCVCVCGVRACNIVISVFVRMSMAVSSFLQK